MREGMLRIAEALLLQGDQDGTIILYPHVSADGDAIGSALALFLALEKLCVSSMVLVDETPPEKLSFLSDLNKVQLYKETDFTALASRQSLALAIDCSDAGRVGRRQLLFEQAPAIAAIDHHVSAGKSIGLKLVETTAAATGELIHTLIRCLETLTETRLMDRKIAACLMAAIISDTGGFVFSNTSATTFRIAADLMEEQLDIRKMTYQLFDRTSQAKLRLTGKVLTDAYFSPDGRIAVGTVTLDLMKELCATDEDLDGLVGQLRSAAGVDVSFMIREMNDGAVRVNIRCDERFNAADFASQFGGGGHPRAAGMNLTGFTLSEAVDLIVRKAGESLSARN